MLPLPTGVAGAKTGWFSAAPYSGCGNANGEKYRNVRVTLTNVVIKSLNVGGYVTIDDGSGPAVLNDQIVGLGQVSGLCGFAVNDTLASITVVPKWNNNQARRCRARAPARAAGADDASRTLAAAAAAGRRLHGPAVRHL